MLMHESRGSSRRESSADSATITVKKRPTIGPINITKRAFAKIPTTRRTRRLDRHRDAIMARSVTNEHHSVKHWPWVVSKTRHPRTVPAGCARKDRVPARQTFCFVMGPKEARPGRHSRTISYRWLPRYFTTRPARTRGSPAGHGPEMDRHEKSGPMPLPAFKTPQHTTVTNAGRLRAD